jgi:hypothetical protein
VLANQDRSLAPLIRPWVRFYARKIDLICFGSVYAIPLAMVGPPISEKYVLACFIITFLWVPIEALLLWSWETTPGKWLLRTQLSDAMGTRFSFSKALRRSLDVWVWGMGIGFIWATWVGLLFGYLDLKDQGNTRWDRAEGIRISHGRIGAKRAAGTMIIVLCFVMITLEVQDLLTKWDSSNPLASLILICVCLTLGWTALKFLVFDTPGRVEA